jgi:glyoxylase-like metal-dependent hydrolase (beta-lactamase superfamily II)
MKGVLMKRKESLPENFQQTIKTLPECRQMFRLMSLMSIFFKPGAFKTFIPDLYLDESFSFTPYGFNGKVIHIPGHSKGSIGILTEDGSFICGDFLYNFFGKPSQEFCDNMEDYHSNAEKIKSLPVQIFYPGHGTPFTMQQFLKYIDN